MDPLSNMIQPHIDRVRPVAQRAAEQAMTYCERIIARLDRIADAVEQDELLYFHIPRGPFAVTAAGGRTTDPNLTVEIPAPEEWTLETVTIQSAAGTTARIISDGIPRFAKTTTVAEDTIAGNGARFQAGNKLQFEVTADATLTLMFKVERKAYARKGIGGAQELGAGDSFQTVPQELYRHTGALR